MHTNILTLPALLLVTRSLFCNSSPISARSSEHLVTHLPPSASYNYLQPAMFLNLTVAQVTDLGSLATGGRQLLGHVISGTLQSEPGFSPQFKGAFRYAEDYVTVDPSDGVSRPHLSGTVYPDDGDAPFLFDCGGIQFENSQVASIVSENKTLGRAVPYGAIYSVWTPSFHGGSARYLNLQTSVFVASETVSDSGVAGEFLVGIKISKVHAVNTTIVIGQEYP